jgi:urease accessory protein
MLTLTTKLQESSRIDGVLRLPFELREKSRLRAKLESGEEVALFTQRGAVLRDGDLLTGEDGRVIRVAAADEATYRVSCASQRELLRCAFHLGNRHTQAQVGSDARGDFLRIRKDAVLKEMLEGLGASVLEENAPFEPEAGAYGGGHHHHGDAHSLLAPVPVRQRIHRPLERE